MRCGIWEKPREGRLEFGAKCEDVGGCSGLFMEGALWSGPSKGPWGKTDADFVAVIGKEVLSCTESSFSIRSASALRVTSKGSKPRSSSCCLFEEPKPKAACQSVEDDTGMVSVRMKTNKCSFHILFVHVNE